MLTLKNIKKKYITNDTVTEAIKGIDLSFRKNEFVSILGPSGGGKTTLLNIIGGLDHYSDGDLIINGKSTKGFGDVNWDTYRNHSVGFVFQSYNLIPHQSVLANVELALTLSGVSKKERRERAIKALEQVGLGDQIKKKPAEMSGGQMQRVAIARALVNDPEILLADEPTGALDTQTSIQVMDILKEVAKDRLVIMVTHNPELAEKYSTRIIKLRDGLIEDDSNPYTEEEEAKEDRTKNSTGSTKTYMSFLTALNLSMNNLLTKKARTILVALAGSIGIIGIALILSLSTGINNYIKDIQRDTLDSYPLVVDKQTIDINSLLESTPMMAAMSEKKDNKLDKVYSNTMMVEQASTLSSSMKENSVADFKKYLDNPSSDINKYIGRNGVTYSYNANFDVFSYDPEKRFVNTDGSGFLEDNAAAKMMLSTGMMDVTDVMDMMSNLGSAGNYVNEFSHLPIKADGTGISKAVTDQYELAYGSWPKEYNDVVLAVDINNEVASVYLYQLGLLPSSEYNQIIKDVQSGKEVKEEVKEFSYEKICNKKFYCIPACDEYVKNGNTYEYVGLNSKDMNKIANEKGILLNVSGIIRVKNDNVAIPTIPAIGYTKALSDYVIDYSKNSQVVKDQIKNKDLDILTGKKFANEQQNLLSQMIGALSSLLPQKSYEANLSKLGYVTEDSPTSINIYADTFEDKDSIIECIKNYNENVGDSDKITYTDYVGIIMTSVTKIINAVTIVLIGFVAVSLVVSSIMIGVITYISVLERIKEIGILRAIGASKRDIRRVFNAETFVIGLSAGLLGVVVTGLMLIPINLILHHVVTSVIVSASFPTLYAILLVVLSVVLTLIAGLFPSKMAANKDPVVALRSE